MMNNINSNSLTGYFSAIKFGPTLIGMGSFAIFSFYCEASIPLKPNIVFILADDLGYGDLSVQGGKDIQTPNIDKLFNEGIRFSNFYANCTVCSPTRASLMTGRYPDMVGVPGVIRTNESDSWGYFLPDAITLPDMLKKAGYQTALIGKWHLGLETPNTPNERGFDLFHGFLGDMMDDYWTHRRHKIKAVVYVCVAINISYLTFIWRYLDKVNLSSVEQSIMSCSAQIDFLNACSILNQFM